MNCIQACDRDFNVTTEENWNICQEQKIVEEWTVYTWEQSTDNIHYSPLTFNSIFTSTQQRQLETVYLQPSVYIRCKVQAVNESGVHGHSRTSEGVLLSQQYHRCSQERWADTQHAKITSYKTFTGHDEVKSHSLLAGWDIN